MKRISILLIFAIVIININLTANNQVNQILSKSDANFYEVQSTLNDYYNSEDASVRKGWKQFKRWEYFWGQRTFPNGIFPNGLDIYQEYQNWEKVNNNKSLDNQIQAKHTWTSIGPFESPDSDNTREQGIGRVNIVRFNPKNELDLWIGTASGGVWRSKNGGNTWTNYPYSNFLSLGVTDIAISKVNPKTIYVVTGDADGTIGSGSNYYSVGIIKSTDDGATWNISGLARELSNHKTFTRLLAHPKEENTLVLGSSDGIYKSTDGGETWKNKYGEKPIIDIEFNPENPSVIYAASYGYSGSNNVLKSIDAGETWKQVYSVATSNRISLEVTPNDPAMVYVVSSSSSNNGFREFAVSEDEGDSWIITANNTTNPNYLGWYDGTGSDSKGQGMYDLGLAVSPVNSGSVYVGGVNIWKSSDLFESAELNTHWYGYYSKPFVHADVHELRFSPSGKRLYACHDGGISFTANGGYDWVDISAGLSITQFYRMGTSNQFPGIIVGGSQDNGTSFIVDNEWGHLYSADGMECIAHPTNPEAFYVSIYYGSIYKTTNGGKSFSNSIDRSATGENAGWVTPYVLDPQRSSVLYAGFNNVWKNTNNGIKASWKKISNFGSSQIIQSIAVAPSDTNTVYAANSSELFKTTNGGTNWTSILKSSSSAITYIAVDYDDPNHIWITKSGFTVNDKVYEFDGINWINLSGNLPNVPVNTIVIQKNSPDRVYIGTDIGVFFSDYGSGSWQKYGEGLPNLIIMELEISYSEKTMIRAASYGLGFWEVEALNCNLPAPQVNVIGKTDICEGDSVILELDGDYTNFVWSNGATTKSIVVKESGAFSVSVSSSEECNAKSKAIVVNVSESKDIAVTTSTTRFALCKEGDEIELRASLGFTKYEWSTGDTVRKISVNKPGKYSVKGYTFAGCPSKLIEMEVFQSEPPAKPTITPDGNYLTSSESFEYVWYRNGKEIKGLKTQIINSAEIGDGFYQVETFNEAGCGSISDSLEVIVNSVDDYSNQSILEILPNPNYGTFDVIFSESIVADKLLIEVVDINGKVVYTQNNENASRISISLNSLNSGTYFLQVHINGKIYTNKFQKL